MADFKTKQKFESLFIGVGDFEDPYFIDVETEAQKEKEPVKDGKKRAQDIYDKLALPGKDHVILTGGEATQQNIIDALKKLAETSFDSDTIVIICFCGYVGSFTSHSEETGSVRFCASDTKIDQLRTTSISAEDFSRYINKIKVNHTLIIIDDMTDDKTQVPEMPAGETWKPGLKNVSQDIFCNCDGQVVISSSGIKGDEFNKSLITAIENVKDTSIDNTIRVFDIFGNIATKNPATLNAINIKQNFPISFSDRPIFPLRVIFNVTIFLSFYFFWIVFKGENFPIISHHPCMSDITSVPIWGFILILTFNFLLLSFGKIFSSNESYQIWKLPPISIKKFVNYISIWRNNQSIIMVAILTTFLIGSAWYFGLSGYSPYVNARKNDPEPRLTSFEVDAGTLVSLEAGKTINIKNETVVVIQTIFDNSTYTPICKWYVETTNRTIPIQPTDNSCRFEHIYPKDQNEFKVIVKIEYKSCARTIKQGAFIYLTRQ